MLQIIPLQCIYCHNILHEDQLPTKKTRYLSPSPLAHGIFGDCFSVDC